MATLANAVDPGTFADLVVASLVESAQATSGTERARSQADDLDIAVWLEPTFTEQLRSAVGLAMARLTSDDIAAGPERHALYALVDKLLPDVRVRHLERKIEQLLDVVADTHDPMAEFQAAVAADNTAIRQRFVQGVETFTSAQVSARAGHEAKNRYQTAARWKALRRIFAVSYQGQDRFPAFQFDADGRPRPVIKKVLEVLPDNRTPWQVAFWFVSSNSWLGGPAPSDRLDDADAVIEAAAHESDEIGG